LREEDPGGSDVRGGKGVCDELRILSGGWDYSEAGEEDEFDPAWPSRDRSGCKIAVLIQISKDKEVFEGAPDLASNVGGELRGVSGR